MSGCDGWSSLRRSRSSPAAAQAEPGHVVLDQEHLESGRVYIEGFEQFVEARGDEEARGKFENRRLELTVPPGAYTLLSYSRPCSASCQAGLDPPRSFCSRRITVGAGQRAAFTVRTKVAARCSIRTR